jgi:outer membrane autotransporter protein
VGGGAAALQRAGLIEDLISEAVSNRTHAAQLGWSFWQEVFGSAARRDAVTDAAGYDTTAAGLVIGADNRMSDNLLVGAALSWSAGWNAGRGDVAANANGVNSLGLTAYGGWRQGALNLNGRLAIGLDHYNQHRDMTYLDDRAKASYSGRHYVIAAESGYDLDLAESFTLTPQASLRWLRLEHDGYSETSAAGMAVRSATADQVQSGVGASLAWNLQTQLGLVTPELKVAWLHDFITEPSQINATLDGIRFITTSERISADGIRIGTGLTFYQSEATSLRLEYGGEFRADYTAHGGMLQLSLKL